MKRISFILLIITSFFLLLASCKCHQKSVVNVAAKFETEDLWLLSEMQGKEVVPLEGQKKISLEFNPEAGTFNGYSGCNRYFGKFKDLGDGRMELSDFNGTKKACPESFHKVESSYMSLLRRCDGYKLGEYALELTQKGKVLLTFEKFKE